jgi:MinD superfamily P-loop ATPase
MRRNIQLGRVRLDVERDLSIRLIQVRCGTCPVSVTFRQVHLARSKQPPPLLVRLTPDFRLDLEPAAAATGTSKAPIVIDVAAEKLSEVIGAGTTLNASLVLIDTPSRLDSLITAAVRVSSLVVLPTNPRLHALAPLRQTVALVEAAGKRHLAVAVNNVEQGLRMARTWLPC